MIVWNTGFGATKILGRMQIAAAGSAALIVGNGVETVVASGTANLTTSQWINLEGQFEYDIVGDDAATFVDNVADGTGESTAIPSAADPAHTLIVGARDTAAWPLDGSMASLIFSKAYHNAAMRANYANYFLTRFATP